MAGLAKLIEERIRSLVETGLGKGSHLRTQVYCKSLCARRLAFILREVPSAVLVALASSLAKEPVPTGRLPS